MSETEFFTFARLLAQFCALVAIPMITILLVGALYRVLNPPEGQSETSTRQMEQELYLLMNGRGIGSRGETRDQDIARSIKNIETMEVDKWTKSFRDNKW